MARNLLFLDRMTAFEHDSRSYVVPSETTPLTPEATAREVTTVLRRLVRGTAPSLDEVAESLGMSGRTLRRRLRSEGAAFQSLLDAVRLELAEQHIEARTMSLAQLSSFLGFSAQTAFNRAFRRWTGKTPQEYARRPGAERRHFAV